MGTVPPRGMESWGGNGRYGVELEGSIPGSVPAVFHRSRIPSVIDIDDAYCRMIFILESS
eukprot:scaffold27685_cov63-Cyclotella_meneghiniana.AAC.2